MPTSETTGMTVRPEAALSNDVQDVLTLGKVLAQSGYFQDAKDAAQAVVKILAGRELGFGPIAAMTGIYIVKGRVTLSANLMASAIKRSRRYDYRQRQLDEKGCVLEFFENGQSLGQSSFTVADATKAGLMSNQTWQQYPRNMLFARAMSNGARWFCPDLWGGPVYTPDELQGASEPIEAPSLPQVELQVETGERDTTYPTASELAREAVDQGVVEVGYITAWCHERGVKKIVDAPERDRIELANLLANKLAEAQP